MMFMGVLVGILFSFAFVLSSPEFILRPLIDTTVKATLAAQPTGTPSSTDSAQQTQLSTNSCDDYGIEITSPVSGDNFPQNGTLHGVYVKKPENVEIWIFSVYKDHTPVEYRPRNVVSLDGNGTWVSKSTNLGVIDSKTELVAFSVGKDARILINYYNLVGRATEQWYALTELPNDLIPCSKSIFVTITPPN